jgi:hypothetical protein
LIAALPLSKFLAGASSSMDRLLSFTRTFVIPFSQIQGRETSSFPQIVRVEKLPYIS